MTIEIESYDTPWEIACKLINAKTHDRTGFINIDKPMFCLDDLEMITQHLLGYVNAERAD